MNLFLKILIAQYVKKLLKIQLSANYNVKNAFALNVPRNGRLEENHVHLIVKGFSNFKKLILDF